MAKAVLGVETSDVEWDFNSVSGEGIFSNKVFVKIASEIQAQYKNTNNEDLLRDLIEVFRVFIFEAWKSLFVHNFFLKTANGYALDLWGNILGLTRDIPSEAVSENYNYFNFNNKKFNKLIFYNPSQPEYGFLSDEAFRKLLLLVLQKQFIQNDTNRVNAFLDDFFSEYGGVSVEDSMDMSRSFSWFLDAMPDYMRYFIFNKDILPRPACVGIGVGNKKNRYFGFQTQDINYNVKNVGAFNATNFIKAAFI